MSGLKFEMPVQPEGMDTNGDWEVLARLIGDANGFLDWSRQKLYTGFTHDSEYVQVNRNRGSGGRHQQWQKSTDGSAIGEMTDAGLSLTALAVSGNATVGGTLGVTGATTLSSTLGVTGATTLSSTLHGVGAVDFDSTLNVDGNATLGGTLDVNGDTTVGGALDVTGDATLGGTLDVTGDTTVGGTLGVTGAATFNGAVTLGNAAADVITVTGTLGVTPPSTFAGETLVTGNTLHASGAGVGVIFGASVGAIYAYDYGAGAYRRLDIDSSDLRLGFEGTTRIRINTTGIGFFGATPVAQQSVGSAATDLASVIDLANDLRTAVLNLGLAS